MTDKKKYIIQKKYLKQTVFVFNKGENFKNLFKLKKKKKEN